MISYQHGQVVDKVAHEQYGHHVADADVLDERHAFGQARGPTVGGRDGHGGRGGRQVPGPVAAAVAVRPDGGRGVAVAVAAGGHQRAGVDEPFGLVQPAQRVVLGVQRPGRTVEERDRRRAARGRRQPEQVVHQAAGRALGTALQPVTTGGARHGGAVAAVAYAVPYAAAAAAGHRGYLGHARRQVGRRVDQQRVGPLPVAGATERGGRGGHQGQAGVQHQREHGVPAVRRRRARVRLRDQRGRAHARAHHRQAGQVVEQQRPAARRHRALLAPQPGHQRQRRQRARLHGVRRGP